MNVWNVVWILNKRDNLFFQKMLKMFKLFVTSWLLSRDVISAAVYDHRGGKKHPVGTVKIRLSGLAFKSSLTMISNKFPLEGPKESSNTRYDH